MSYDSWKRPVKLSECASEREADVCAIKCAIPEENGLFSLQIKSEAWEGEYIDLSSDDPILDRFNLRIVLLKVEVSSIYPME